MCGIAGIIDITGRRPIPPDLLQRMADAITHRGPDEDGYFEAPGIGLANRRLSIVGLADGRQPVTNEDSSIVTVFNGEFFDYPARKSALEARGHRFRTHCDIELIPHLWEDHGEETLERLRGQFAVAVWNRERHTLVLARDRFGICPLYFTRQCDDEGEWLLFASEIKSLLASGMIDARPDLRGIDQVFNFFAVPGPATCFEGIEYLAPGEYLRIQTSDTGHGASVSRHRYWQLTFPDGGAEDRGDNPEKLVDEFERVLLGAVERRLRADVPVVSYLSGGVDSSLVVAMAAKIRGTPIPTFTIKIQHPRLDETSQAAIVSRHIGSTPLVVAVGSPQILQTYPELTWAAEAPVVDTSCAAVLLLARAVNRQGYKVALTGEGSDEWMAGYPWHKVNRLLTILNAVPGLPIGSAIRKLGFRTAGATTATFEYLNRVHSTIGDHTAFQDFYSLMALNRATFYSDATLEALGDWSPYLDIEVNPDRVKRWHPVNRALYWGARIHLPGHLLTLKGDRLAMNSSVEVRYPFLDEEVFEFLVRLHPRWKIRGFRDKYILRLVAERYLPREVAWRPKGMFRAPLDSFLAHEMPTFVDELLSEGSLRKTGYFNVEAVQYWRTRAQHGRLRPVQRVVTELGLMGVMATQLWHHTLIDSSLSSLPVPGPIQREQPGYQLGAYHNAVISSK